MRTVVLLLSLAAAGAPLAQESKVQLADGPGKDKAQACIACHSVDYIEMNSKFLDKAGWTASVTKMIKVFGAPIPESDVGPIADYLAAHYGRPAAK